MPTLAFSIFHHFCISEVQTIITKVTKLLHFLKISAHYPTGLDTERVRVRVRVGVRVDIHFSQRVTTVHCMTHSLIEDTIKMFTRIIHKLHIPTGHDKWVVWTLTMDY